MDVQLNLILFNCRSIRSKVAELEQLATDHNANIVCLCETSLENYKYAPKLPRFTSEWKHRPGGQGGGLGMLIHESLIYQTITLNPLPNGELEVQVIQVTCPDQRKILILNIYNQNRNITIEELRHY
jgi:hypothetical protein